MDLTETLTSEIRRIVREELELNRPVPTTNRVGTEEAADRWDVTPRTIRRWIKDGRLKPYKAGRVIRVDLDELDALMASDGRVRGSANGGSLRNGNQAPREISPEERAVQDELEYQATRCSNGTHG